MPRISIALVALSIGAVLTVSARHVVAAAPSLYTEPFHQSPVEGAPDDLLLIAGGGLTAGATVVYERLLDTTLPLPTPTEVPPTSTADRGVAPIVSETALPDNIVIRLPQIMAPGESYALWVRSLAGEWSRGIKINDARPLWVTPASMPRSGSIASLPRELKVVGRNLQRAPGAITQVRLTGAGAGNQFILPAADDGQSSTSIERYVARVELPPVLSPGEYKVEVMRDGRSWVPVSDQQFIVTENPAGPPQAVRVDAYGCRPGDTQDDTPCFQQALLDLPSTGGVVFIPAGLWDLMTPPHPDNGLIVRAGIHLQGEGPLLTRIVRKNAWNGKVLFTLLGRNQVSGIYFDDEFLRPDLRSVHFQLGKRPSATPDPEPRVIEDIVFTANVFRGMNKAIGGGGLPVRRLYITDNVLNAFQDSLFIDAYYLPREDGARFDLQDSVIARNLFLPGAYVNRRIAQGAIASQIGAAQRVDVSENVADGRPGGGAPFQPPGNTPPATGWRAGFFFHQNNNHERMLISRNVMSCTGDKAGDGEAIAYDHAVNKYAFDAPAPVVMAGADRVTVRGALLDAALGAYAEHWIQIVDGPGVGQSRRIRTYMPLGSEQVQFVIEPPWEVLPGPGSAVVVTRQYWQTYIVDNEIDIRGCTKKNPNVTRSGSIEIWAQTSDSAVDGNTQYESDGIHITAGHSIEELPDVPRRVHFPYFLDVRRNRIIDEYDYQKSHWSLTGSFSGILLIHWTLTNRAAAQVAYGLSIAQNRVVHADGSAGGAISITQAWYSLHYPPSTDVQTRSVLIHHNDIRDIQCTTDYCRFDPVDRIGIHIADRWAWDTTLYANQLTNCNEGIVNGGMQTTQVPTQVGVSGEARP